MQLHKEILLVTKKIQAEGFHRDTRRMHKETQRRLNVLCGTLWIAAKHILTR
jgi:hypothetical protein